MFNILFVVWNRETNLIRPLAVVRTHRTSNTNINEDVCLGFFFARAHNRLRSVGYLIYVGENGPEFKRVFEFRKNRKKKHTRHMFSTSGRLET